MKLLRLVQECVVCVPQGNDFCLQVGVLLLELGVGHALEFSHELIALDLIVHFLKMDGEEQGNIAVCESEMRLVAVTKRCCLSDKVATLSLFTFC